MCLMLGQAVEIDLGVYLQSALSELGVSWTIKRSRNLVFLAHERWRGNVGKESGRHQWRLRLD